jgi:hypothetical protein
MIIGICGLIGSGKGTVADLLVHEFGFHKVSFADSLKDAVAAVFGWPRYLLEGDTDESREWREQVDEWWAQRLQIPDLTPRWVLQYWGTEVLRRNFHDDIWVAATEHKLRDHNQNYVIPDTRFPNEVDMIARSTGCVWWTRRGPSPDWFTAYQGGDDSVGLRSDVHPSEYMWARSRFDAVIDNDGTKEDLLYKVRQQLTVT